MWHQAPLTWRRRSPHPRRWVFDLFIVSPAENIWWIFFNRLIFQSHNWESLSESSTGKSQRYFYDWFQFQVIWKYVIAFSRRFFRRRIFFLWSQPAGHGCVLSTRSTTCMSWWEGISSYLFPSYFRWIFVWLLTVVFLNKGVRILEISHREIPHRHKTRHKPER